MRVANTAGKVRLWQEMVPYQFGTIDILINNAGLETVGDYIHLVLSVRLPFPLL